jgi:long-chain fatty acid transport protein
MKKIYLKSTLVVAVAAASSQVLANGLALNEQNASGAGTAYAGRASTVRDASILYGNPAGLSRLDRAQVSVGAAFIHADTDISNAQGLAPGTNKGDMVPDSTVPFAYFATPLEGNWHFGVGLYAPFGVAGDYEKSFMGRYEGLKSEVKVVTLQPTLSYAFNDRVSVGVGPTFNRIEGRLTSAIPGILVSSPTEAGADIEGHDTAVGYNAGVLVAVTDKLDWGLTYHSKVEYTLNGNLDITGVTGPAAPVINGHYSGTLDITMPESVDSSFTYRLDDQWTLFAGATWTRWSRLEEIAVENGSPLGTVREEMNWDDTLAFAVGSAYQLNPQWQLRAGFAVDPSPTNNEDRTVRIPVSNRKTATLGAGWSPTPDVTVDMAYAYLWESESQVNQDTYQADFKNSAHGVSAQVTYRF